MLFILFSHSEVIEKGAVLAEKRASLLKIVLTLSLGVLFTGTINIAAASIAQAQYDLANHSTLPSLTLTVNQADETPEYNLSSPVGSAAYISLGITDRIFFRYEDTPCELEVNQRTALSNGTGSIDASFRSASFRPTDHFTETENAQRAAIRCIQTRLPEVESISLDRCYKVTYFDYQNRQATCHFSISADGQPRLTQTTSHHYLDNNAGSITHAGVSYEKAVTASLDHLLSRFLPVSEGSKMTL